MSISHNFTMEEMTFSSLALRHGKDNTPDEDQETNLIRVAVNILQRVRDHFGIPFSPSSGFRSEAVNGLAGGSRTSDHLTGRAVDFELPGIPNRVLADWIKANLTFDQLILEFHDPAIPNSGWVHCSFRLGNNRQQCLIFDGTNYREF